MWTVHVKSPPVTPYAPAVSKARGSESCCNPQSPQCMSDMRKESLTWPEEVRLDWKHVGGEAGGGGV